MTAHISWVRTFEAAARCGSLTQAGAELGLTQAAVSQHIKALETHLRTQLFKREARGVSLTGAGSELYLEVVEGLHRIDVALQRHKPSSSGSLFVLSNTSLTIRWLLPRLPAFCQRYPRIDLRLGTVLRRTDAFGLQCDLELYLAPLSGDNSASIVADGEMAAVCAPRLADTWLRGLRAGKLRIATVVSYESMYRAWADATLGPKWREVASLSLDSFYAALALTEAEQAVTICPRLLAADALKSERLVELPPVAPTTGLKYWCAIRNTRSGPAATFNDWILDQIEQT